MTDYSTLWRDAHRDAEETAFGNEAEEPRLEQFNSRRRDASKPQTVATASTQDSLSEVSLFFTAQESRPREARGMGEWLGKQSAYHAQHMEQRVLEEDTWVRTCARKRRHRRADESGQPKETG